MNWIDVAQDRDQWKALVNTATFGFHKNVGKIFSGLATGGFSRRAQLMKVNKVFLMVKVKLSLCLINYREVNVYILVFLTSALVGSE
jgi:hypothetical protein